MQSWSETAVPSVPGQGPPLRLFDTADRQVRPVTPGRTATMYVCGITPYDATHLGHAATYLAFDLVNRMWRDAGHDVHYVQNVTDVDDPLLERADRDGEDWVVLGMRETALFREDMTALRVLPPRDYIGAVESIPRIVAMSRSSSRRAPPTSLDDPEVPDVYFRRPGDRAFGYESGYDEATMCEFFAERGGDPDRPGKRRPLDALLWRGGRPGGAVVAGAVGPGPPRLAHRVLGDRAEPHRHGFRRAGRRQRPDLPAPRVLRGARRGGHGRPPLRPALRAHGDDRSRRREDAQEPRQPRVRLQAARRGRRPGRGNARAARLCAALAAAEPLLVPAVTAGDVQAREPVLR